MKKDDFLLVAQMPQQNFKNCKQNKSSRYGLLSELFHRIIFPFLLLKSEKKSFSRKKSDFYPALLRFIVIFIVFSTLFNKIFRQLLLWNLSMNIFQILSLTVSKRDHSKFFIMKIATLCYRVWLTNKCNAKKIKLVS